MKPSSYRESYVGAEGTHLLIGYDIESEWGRQISYTAPQNYNITTYPGALAAYNPASPYYGPWYDQDTIVHGPDAVFHHKALTATVAYKYRITSWSTNTDAAGAPVDPDDTHSDAFAISLAYAIPVSDMAIEPAFRYSYLNADRKRDEYSNYGRGFDYNSFATPATASPWASNRNDTTGSGDQFELGVNMYWNTKVGHSNKTQLAYVNWQAEEGVGRASAVVVQHQLLF
jgi:hypothetical protein